MLKSWLVFFRPHTASFHISLVLIGFTLGGGQPFSLNFLLWGILGFAFHIFGFGHNNLADLEFDARDSTKSHLPLVSGAISLRDATTVTMIGVGGIALFVAVLTDSAFSLFFYAIAGVMGFVYNHTSKTFVGATLWAPIPPAALLLTAFFASGSQASFTIIMLTLYVYFATLFHYLIAGDGKDLDANEANLLRKLGARFRHSGTQDNPYLFIPSKAQFVVLSVGILHWAMLMLLRPAGMEWMTFIAAGIVGFLPIILNRAWYTNTTTDRKRRDILFKRFLLGAVAGYNALILMLSPLLGLGLTVFMLFFFPSWLILWNKALWGTGFSIRRPAFQFDKNDPSQS